MDPGSIEALVGTALVELNRGVLFSTDDRATPVLAAEAILLKLLALAPQCASAKLLLGVAHIFTDRAAQGIAECEQALWLNRNLANAHGWIAIGKYFLGRAEDTEAHVQEALRLSPRDICAYRWLMYIGLANVYLKADAEAVFWLRRSIEANRNLRTDAFLSRRPLGVPR